MRSNLMVAVLFVGIWVVAFVMMAVSGPSSPVLVFLIAALSAWFYASNRAAGPIHMPGWRWRHNKR